MSGNAIRVRRALRDIQNDYDAGKKDQLEALWRAWRAIEAIPPNDPNHPDVVNQDSYFVIGGYHGEPFRGAGWGTSAYWGGYCNHGNVLFPTWHRAYLLRLENALRSVPGCQDVTLPFWDETSDASAQEGLPWALTRQTVVLDGQEIPNPLRSFVFTSEIVDHLSPIPDANYGKPYGYETVRYPLSGLVGTPEDRRRTDAHNSRFSDPDRNTRILNRNVVAWLTSSITVDGKVIPTNVRDKYRRCLHAPNYTVFSNTTSAAEWNDHHVGAGVAVPLESPHNSVHLAIGGYDVPGQGDYSPIPGANGDMGENDTAGLDPVFFFHHCHVDRMFWLWQQAHDATDQLEIMAGYPGTNSVDSQGPTPGTAPNSWLGVDSPLDPFRHEDGTPFTSRECVNIERQLGYTYGPGSLSAPVTTAGPDDPTRRVVTVGGINRAAIPGSFVISAYADTADGRHYLGREAILSRWHVDGCMNCQTHLEARAHIRLTAAEAAIADDDVHVEITTRDRGGFLTTGTPAQGPQFTLTIRNTPTSE